MKFIFLILSLLATFVFGQKNLSFTSNKKRYQPPNLSMIELKDGNFISVRGPMNGISTSRWIDEAMRIEDDEIFVYISSPGGSVVAGHNFIAALETLQQSGKKITCIGDVSISMAFVLLQYCPVRQLRSSSVLMQHQMSLGLQDSIEHVESYLSFVNSMKNTLNSHQAERMNLTQSEFESHIRSDWWMHGYDGLKNNAGDEIVHVLCHPSLANKRVMETFQTWFGPVDVVFSGCPLARDPLEIKFQKNHTYTEKDKAMIKQMFEMNSIINKYDNLKKYLV